MSLHLSSSNTFLLLTIQAVWKRWTESTEDYNTAGYQSFADPDDFEVKLEACLRQWLERRGVVAKGPVWNRAAPTCRFRHLSGGIWSRGCKCRLLRGLRTGE